MLILDNSSRLDGAPSPFFHVWFQNGSVVEWVQWACLATTAGMGLWMAGRLIEHKQYADLRYFWLLLGAGALLLLIEDTGDPRHAMEGFLSLLYPVLPAGFPIKPAFELLIYFPLLAALPVFALYRYYHNVKDIPYVARYLWIGFGFYAIAAVCSASSGIGNWYHAAGGIMLEFFSEQLLREDLGLFSVVFFLMDSLVEESIELVGAGGLMAATVAQYHGAYLVPPERAAEAEVPDTQAKVTKS